MIPISYAYVSAALVAALAILAARLNASRVVAKTARDAARIQLRRTAMFLEAERVRYHEMAQSARDARELSETSRDRYLARAIAKRDMCGEARSILGDVAWDGWKEERRHV